jgi:transcription termination factor Rho
MAPPGGSPDAAAFSSAPPPSSQPYMQPMQPGQPLPGLPGPPQGGGRRRRRRSRGNNRPLSNVAPQPYGNNHGQPQPQGRPPMGRSQGQRRRGRGRGDQGRTNGGDRRGGLEVLRDMQQIGAALDPTERFILELPPGKGNPPYGDRITGRAIDIIAPIGRGQRCLIVSPPKAGKTRILQSIAASIAYNHPEVAVYALLVDERPEEVTDFKRNTPATVIAASSDMSIDEHIETTEHAMEVVARQVLESKDVVLLLDSITRLARAYNAGSEGSGRTMSGGLDSQAMQSPRQIFGAARKIEGGGSLTIFGTALIDTGSRMDQVIFEEFKGTGNSEIYLSRELAERRIYPAIDIQKSGTRKEEKLYPSEIVPRLHLLRRGLAGLHPQEAMTKLLELLNRCKTNAEIFELLRA